MTEGDESYAAIECGSMYAVMKIRKLTDTPLECHLQVLAVSVQGVRCANTHLKLARYC